MGCAGNTGSGGGGGGGSMGGGGGGGGAIGQAGNTGGGSGLPGGGGGGGSMGATGTKGGGGSGLPGGGGSAAGGLGQRPSCSSRARVSASLSSRGAERHQRKCSSRSTSQRRPVKPQRCLTFSWLRATATWAYSRQRSGPSAAGGGGSKGGVSGGGPGSGRSGGSAWAARHLCRRYSRSSRAPCDAAHGMLRQRRA